MKDLWRVIQYAAQKRGLFTLITIMSVILVGLSLYIPWVYKEFFDLIQEGFVNNKSIIDNDQFYWFILLYLLLHIAQTTISAISDYLADKWWYHSMQNIQLMGYSHLQSLSLKFYEENSTGKIKERVDAGAFATVTIFNDLVRNVVVKLFVLIFSAIILLKYNLIFGVIATSTIPIFVIMNAINARRWMKIAKKTRKSFEKASGYVTESIVNVSSIKSFAREKQYYNKLQSIYKNIVKNFLKEERLRIGFRVFRFSIRDVVRVATIFIGVYMIGTGNLSLGGLILVISYMDKILGPVNQIVWHIENIQKELVKSRMFFEFMDTQPDIKDYPNANKLKVKEGNIELNKITFKYKDRNVLNKFSLNIPSCQTVAFVGKSGVGKTTILKLLLRYYDPNNGNIKIDGQDIKEITQKSLRESIATVLQDAQLSNDTVINNIKFAKPNAKKEDIFEAAKKANAHDFIKKLPKGYKTIIGERGIKLSGGEQQRINIARAILKDAPILILDEATSSLDSESEVLIQEAMEELIRDRTTIIIAHRLSTVMKADMIVVMDKGKIAQIGTHEDLVKKKGIYAKLYEIQSGGYLA